MKHFLIVLISLIFLFVVLLAWFYVWASSGRLDEKEHAEIIEYPIPDENVSSAGLYDSTLTLVTYNIGYGSGMINNTTEKREAQFFENNLHRVEEVLHELDPDFVLLQEIDYDASRSFHVDQESRLAAALDLAFAARGVNWDKQYVPFPQTPFSAHFGAMLSGQSILSRYPIIAYERLVLDRVESYPFWYNAFYLDRLAQVCRVLIDGEEVVLINVHLEAFDAITREIHMKRCAELYLQYCQAYPTIMAGDFNSDTSEEALLKEHIMGLPHIAGAPVDHSIKTYPSARPDQRLDYIFYNKNRIRSLKASVISEVATASDHLPLVMQFTLQNEIEGKMMR